MMNEYPKLLDENINSWLKFRAEKRMLRTLDDKLRAFCPIVIVDWIIWNW